MKYFAITLKNSNQKFIIKHANKSIKKTISTIKLFNINKILFLQNQEKNDNATELKIANKELLYQNIEREKRALELTIANKELAFQKIEKMKRADELTFLFKELEKAEKYQNNYIDGLKEIMFITSHDVRLPLANIIGISEFLNQIDNTPEEINLCLDYLKKSALSLETSTKELTFYISNLEQKSKTNGNIKYV